MFRQIVLCFLLAMPAYGMTGQVVTVVDGDTLKVATDQGIVTVRLYGIDTPEKKQEHGLDAKEVASNLVIGKDINFAPVGTDLYKRTVAVVMYGDLCLQEQMLISGYAWVYPQYCKESFCKAWQTLQKISADNKWGLWADPMPVQPWIWRKQQR